MKWLFGIALLCILTTGCDSASSNGDSQMKHGAESGRSDREAESMKDEEAVRQWFDDWIRATTEGDLELARRLIADDAIFLVPGAGQMDKESFAAAATATDPNTEFELDCSIQEIRILGDHAWLLSTISLAMTDKTTRSTSLMKGDSLSVLQRKGDRWVVVRDANTMVAVESAP